MKGLKYLFSLVLMIAVACSPETPTPAPGDNNGGTEQETPAPVLTITSAKSFIAIAEGEEYTVTYSVENPVADTSVEVTIEDNWISIKEGVTEENTIVFVIAENTSEAPRSATVELSYGEASAEVKISQAGAVIVNNDPLSTLTNDVEMELNEDTYVFADCYGDDNGTGIYIWQFYFMDVINRQMIWLEVLYESQAGATTEELVIPTGKFVGSDDKWSIGTLMIGHVIEDFDGLYNAGSWYTQAATETQAEALAPIAGGVFTIEAIEGSDTFRANFDVKDDLGNRITGAYEGRITIEDFRTE